MTSIKCGHTDEGCDDSVNRARSALIRHCLMGDSLSTKAIHKLVEGHRNLSMTRYYLRSTEVAVDKRTDRSAAGAGHGDVALHLLKAMYNQFATSWVTDIADRDRGAYREAAGIQSPCLDVSRTQHEVSMSLTKQWEDLDRDAALAAHLSGLSG